MKKLVFVSTAALLLSGPAFAQLDVDGKGMHSGGYVGSAERKLGIEDPATGVPSMRREAPLNVDGKGTHAGGYVGSAQRKLGVNNGGPATTGAVRRRREAPLNVDGKGTHAGGYIGSARRKLGE